MVGWQTKYLSDAAQKIFMSLIDQVLSKEIANERTAAFRRIGPYAPSIDRERREDTAKQAGVLQRVV
jgi:hypothetical protein